jgi:hypothetical protein
MQIAVRICMGNLAAKNEYYNFINEIKKKIRKSQYEALKTVNKELISLYSDIGKMIIER